MPGNDLPDDMNDNSGNRFGQNDPLHLDDNTVDGLLDGSLESTPAAYENVSGMLSSLAAVDGESDTDPSFIEDMTRAVADYRPESRRKRVLSKLITAKAVSAIAGVVVLSSGGVAAAATGSLPDPVQNVAHSAAAKVSVDLPKGHENNPGNASCKPSDSTSTSTSTTVTLPPTASPTAVAAVNKPKSCDEHRRSAPKPEDSTTVPSIQPAPPVDETVPTKPPVQSGDDNGEHATEPGDDHDGHQNGKGPGDGTSTTEKASNSGKGSGDVKTTTTKKPEEHASTTARPVTTTTKKPEEHSTTTLMSTTTSVPKTDDGGRKNQT